MKELLFLLLPVAALSGWYIGVKSNIKKSNKKQDYLSSKYFSGLNYIINEQPDRAVDIFLQLLDSDNSSVDIHLMLGNLFRKRGEVDRAIKVHKSILIKDNLPQGCRNILNLELAKDYISAGLLDRAENILLSLVEQGKELDASLVLLTNIYQESKDWEKAINSCNKLQSVSKIDYTDKITHFFCEIAKSAIDSNNITQARKFIKQSLKYNRYFVRANLMLADIEISIGKFKAAINILDSLLPKAEDYLVEIIPRIIKCYKKLGRESDIQTFWGEILKNNNNIKIVLAYVGYLQSTHGDIKALHYLDDHLQKYPSILGLSKIIELNLFLSTDKFKDKLENFNEVIARLIQKNYSFKCETCGLASKTLEWLCPSCKQWSSFKSASLFEIN